ncbi:MAG: hypothetical protein JW814_11490 [Candidatus Krumholzibacteriota bacterium]|nr:hypothetical protein [Candidatus Krumholzibacteriota bacterium]
MERAMKRSDYLVVTASVALMIILALPLRGSITDDTYIHMQYARNLVEAGELSFNRGEPTYGATSPLWVLLLATVYRLGGEMALWSRILSLFFGVASIYMVYRFMIAIGMGSYPSAIASAIFASEAWVIRWSMVGMESSMAVFIVIAAVMAALGATRSLRRSMLFGALLFLAYLARPETLLLLPLSLISFSLFRGGAGGARRYGWLLIFIPAIVIWFLVIRDHTGTWFPLTAGAKQGTFDFSPVLLTRMLVPVKILSMSVGIAIIVLLLFLTAGIFFNRDLLRVEDETRRPGLFLALIWIFALPAAYVLIDFQIISRYLIPVSPFIIIFATGSIVIFSGRHIRRRTNLLLTVFAAAVIAQNILFLNLFVVGPTRDFSRGLEDVLVKIGIYLSENSDPGDVIAAPDIGAVGYFSGRKILDLGGLVTPEINKMRSKVDYETLIERGDYLPLGADYFLDRSRVPVRFSGRVIRGVLFTPVMSGTVANLGIRQPGEVTYVLYRLDRPSGDGGSELPGVPEEKSLDARKI